MQYPIPDGLHHTANDFLVRFAAHLETLSPVGRVNHINQWLPALRNQRSAIRAGVDAFDQAIVLITLRSWLDEQAIVDLERAA